MIKYRQLGMSNVTATMKLYEWQKVVLELDKKTRIVSLRKKKLERIFNEN